MTELPEVVVETATETKKTPIKKQETESGISTAASLPSAKTNASDAAPETALIGNLPAVYAGGQVARGGQLGILGNRDVMDAPFAISSYTEELIRNQQAKTLADVIDNDPSVSANIRGRGSNNGGGDVFNIRGFPVLNSEVAFNGLYGILPFATVDMIGVERVEIFKGPNAMLNGMAPNGGVGGTINVVPKRAGDDPLTRVTTSYESDAFGSVHLDVGRRYGDEKQLGIRFNGQYGSGDLPVDDQKNELQTATLGVDFRGSTVRVSADLGYQNDNTDVPTSWGGGLRGAFFAGSNIPDPPDASNRSAQLWEYADNRDVYGAVRAEVDIAPEVTAYAAAGARQNDQTNLRTAAYLVDELGTLALLEQYYPQYSNTESYAGGIRGNIRGDGGRHEWSIGATRLNIEAGYGFDSLSGILYSDLYDVTDYAKPSTAILSNAQKSAETYLTSYAVADTIVLADERVWLTLGLRRQFVEQENFDPVSGVLLSSYDEASTTPSVGLVVKPWRNVSLYGNYIEGLTQGDTAPAGTANQGEVFPPTKTEQTEAGIKIEFQSLIATLGAFKIVQPNAITRGNVYTVDGEQINRGVEFSLVGKLTEEVRILGGVMYVDPEQGKTQNGTNDGNDAVGVANWNGKVNLEWAPGFVPGLTLTGRAVATSSQYVDAANTLDIPGWARFDVGARYEFAGYELRANVINVLDEDYWESADPSTGLRIGAPRTFFVSFSSEF